MLEELLVLFQKQFLLMIGIFFYFFSMILQKIKDYSHDKYLSIVRVGLFFDKHIFILGGLFLFIVFLLPSWILQKKMAIQVFDEFDHIFVHYVTLARNGNFFIVNPLQPVVGYMSGIPRLCLPSSLNIMAVLFLLFKPIHAYLINLTLVKVIAYGGMYLLLRRYVCGDLFPRFIAAGCALCFSILPLYPFTGLCIYGLPFLFYALLNILRNERLFLSFLIVALFPIYSLLWYSNFFIIVAWAVVIVVNYFLNKKFIVINKRFLLAFCLFTILSLLCDYQLIIGCLSSVFISVRVEKEPYFSSLGVFFKNMIDAFIYSNSEDAWSNHARITGLCLPFFLLVVSCKKIQNDSLNFYKRLSFKVLNLILVLIFISHIVELGAVYKFLPSSLSMFLQQITLKRFFIFLPPLWYILLCTFLSFFYLMPHFRFISIAILLSQFFFLFNDPSPLKKSINLVMGFVSTRTSYITFESFFAEKVFEKLKSSINKIEGSYQVASIGLIPEIATYNGLYSIDGYIQNSPLAYRRDFRKIIDTELSKNERLSYWFSTECRRYYILPSDMFLGENSCDSLIIGAHRCEGSYLREKIDFIQKKKINLDINCEQLKKMECQYLISAVEIENYKKLDLKIIDIFSDDSSIWRLFLYKVY